MSGSSFPRLSIAMSGELSQNRTMVELPSKRQNITGGMVGIHTKDEDWQLHMLGHLNLGRNFFSAIIVGDGGIVISNV